jgi:hypothetical protein
MEVNVDCRGLKLGPLAPSVKKAPDRRTQKPKHDYDL